MVPVDYVVQNNNDGNLIGYDNQGESQYYEE